MPPRAYNYKPRTKLFFGLNDNKDKDYIVKKLIDYKDDNSVIKSFNSYLYQEKLYFNIYLNKVIETDKGFNEITSTFDRLFSKTFIYTYKNNENIVLYKSIFDGKKVNDSIKTCYNPKLYTMIDETDLDDFIDLLKTYKIKYNNIKSFNGYKYNGRQYLNIFFYNDETVKNIGDFDDITRDFNHLFEKNLQFKYKDCKNEILYSSLYKKPSFVDED